MPELPRPSARHIAVEFVGGPLDGWSSGQMTEETVRYPEDLYCAWGHYHLTMRGLGWYAYQWHEYRPDEDDPS